MPTSTKKIFGTSRAWSRTLSMRRLLKPLSDNELTKSSWARCIQSYADIPQVYRAFFDPVLSGGCAFPYAVLTPSYERFIHKTTEKLICDFGDVIYVLERKGDLFETQPYPIEGISYVECRTALLASSFKICGMTDRGIYTSSTLKFNTVTDHLFTAILKRARPVPVGDKHFDQNAEIEKFNCLADVSFKFMNFAKRSLLEGEKVLQFIFQPEIQEKVLTVLNKNYYRTVSATHLGILTDRELILIQEDASQRKEDRYGGIWDYIPLHKVASLSVNEKAGDLVVLTVELPAGTRFELLWQASAEEELHQLFTRFKELTAP